MKIDHYKELLLEEQKHLLDEMKSVGRKEPGNPDNWEGTEGDISEDVDASDENSVADKLEEFETRNAVETELEDRLQEVKDALARIDEENYGICKVCGKEIEEARLEANAAAETCMAHLNN
jgi:RNA polymerase-binding transcription factor DksA